MRDVINYLAGQDTATDGDLADEGALLVCSNVRFVFDLIFQDCRSKAYPGLFKMRVLGRSSHTKIEMANIPELFLDQAFPYSMRSSSRPLPS
jgi:hypothetical protein